MMILMTPIKTIAGPFCTLLPLLALILAGFIVPSSAQAPGSSLAANYAANSEEPIDIEADALEVNDQKKIATFSGNVSATQGDFNLRAKEIQVFYSADKKKPDTGENAAASGPGANSQITKINANGKVLVTTKDNQKATSDWAHFDVKTQLVTIGGNVVLSEGFNTIKGNRLVIDLKSGVSRFENSQQTAAEGDDQKPKQRLRAIFSTKGRSSDAQN